MDLRVIENYAAGAPPVAPGAPSIGYPTDGVPGGAPAGIPGAYWFHQIAESLRRVLLSAGLAPDHLNLDLLTRAIGALRSAKFTANGSFTVPPGITTLYVSAVAGGGGGGGACSGIGGSGAGGNAGQFVLMEPYVVVPATVIGITVGAGGSGGALSTDGTAGGNTQIGALVTLSGGGGGQGSVAAGGGLPTGTGFPRGSSGTDGPAASSGGGGGAGASSPFGGGGGGGRAGTGAGNVGQPAGGYGAGGGGGGGAYNIGTGAVGAAGTPGLVLLSW